MKISEYEEETQRYVAEFEKVACKVRDGVPYASIDLYRLFDVIDLRMSDVDMWLGLGLTMNDDVPKRPDRIIVPSFELKSDEESNRSR